MGIAFRTCFSLSNVQSLTTVVEIRRFVYVVVN